MNSATKKEKAPLMVAIITTMVEQGIARDAQKAKMEEEMMRHMMRHMQMGKSAGELKNRRQYEVYHAVI